MDSVSDVDIDPDGCFKYILIQVTDKSSDKQKLIVRGYGDCDYHADIYDRVCPAIEQKNLDCECVGGGRILHNNGSKELTVYGYSQGFGRANHAKTTEILKRHFKDYKISWTNDGY